MTYLWGMFSGAFLAATLLPGGSELLLVMLINQHTESWLSLVIFATLGNTLGSMTSFYLGHLGRFAKTPENLASSKHQKAITIIQNYGTWGLLLAWLPIIGDMLCLIAGWLKLPVLRSSIMILLGKAIRYLIIAISYIYLA